MLRLTHVETRSTMRTIVSIQVKYTRHKAIWTPCQSSCLWPLLYNHALAVVWRPDASDAGLGARYGLVRAAQLGTAGITQELHLLQNFVWCKVSYADGLRAAVDVMSDDDGVLSRARRDGEFDLGVARGDLGEQRLDEATVMKDD